MATGESFGEKIFAKTEAELWQKFDDAVSAEPTIVEDVMRVVAEIRQAEEMAQMKKEDH